jgi:hypothetical protein
VVFRTSPAENTDYVQRQADKHEASFAAGYDEGIAAGKLDRRPRSIRSMNDQDSDSLDEDSRYDFTFNRSQSMEQEQESRLLEDWYPGPEITKTDQADMGFNVPQILWRVDVYRRGLGDREHPEVTFRNDRPYDLSLCQSLPTSRTQPSETLDSEQKDVLVHPPDQPVFELETRVLEQAKAKGSKHRPRGDVRESFDQLQVEKLAKTRMIIHSKALSDALVSLVSYYPALPRAETPSVIPEPYDLLMHHFSAIENFAEGNGHRGESKEAKDIDASCTFEQSNIAVQHMKLLYNFLKPRYDTSIKPCLDDLSQTVPQVSFDMLWYFFRPGIDIYVQSDDMISVCVVREVTSNLDQTHWLSSTTPSHWDIDAWHLVTNGTRIARTKVTHQIRSYTGLRDVASLPICPVSYWDTFDGGVRRQQIMRRSEMYVRALEAGNMLVSYDGPDLRTQRQVRLTAFCFWMITYLPIVQRENCR